MIDLPAAGPGEPLCLVVVPGRGLAVAWNGSSREIPTERPAEVVAELATGGPRWVWWSARFTAAPLVAAGLRVSACWDLGAVGRLVHGLRRDDPAAVWAAQAGLAEPPAPHPRTERSTEPALFDLGGGGPGGERPDDGEERGPVRRDRQLDTGWAEGGWAGGLAAARRWAELGLELQQRQAASLLGLMVGRDHAVGRQPIAVRNAHAESAAALLAVELEHDGLPMDRRHATALLEAVIGRRPADAAAEARTRRDRDGTVLRHFPAATDVDLRSPRQVRTLLTRIGLDVPDTRSWRLAPHASTSPAVEALLAWRKAERIATTYGWRWLDTQVGSDGRLRGRWSCADGGAGRMTAQAGLHNLPADLRDAVRAEPGHRLVRADLGQIEPRVLAAVSGDEALTAAARQADLYAPVAERLRCDRPTAKIAVLAAMYGQTSGAAGEALRQMDRAYPRAMAFLRAAEQAGRSGHDLRTYGGRLLRLGPVVPAAEPGDPRAKSRGRYARNAVVQGAAAEFFKGWAATVRAGLRVTDGQPTGQIVLCLHDELLLHVPEAQTDAAVALLHSALAATSRWWVPGSGVRFVVEVAVGASWADAHG